MTKFGIEKKPFDVLKDLAEKHKVLRKFCKTKFPGRGLSGRNLYNKIMWITLFGKK